MSFALLAGVLAVSQSPTLSEPNGFLAAPKIGRAPGVLVLHPWWGLNGDVKILCDLLAQSGFTAYAPDLFHGKTAKSRVEAEALVKEFEPKADEINAEIREAAKFLAKRSGSQEIAVIGLSFGAYFALHLSNEEPGLVKAVVTFYGTGQEDFSRSKAAYLGHFAEKDEFEPKAGVDKLKKLLHDAGRPAKFYTYPKTGHWFFEPTVVQAYRKEAADLAWKRTLDFLRKTLPK